VSAVIQADGLRKMYGKRRGLDGLDLEVREGEVYGFLGPNGAGKTTTIRILLDLIRPSGGSATVFGIEPRAGGTTLRRRLGYLPGDFTVLGGQTGRELLVYLANLRGGVAFERIAALAERFELDLSVRVGSLSKGNRQKLGVVQAFMHQPELLVLDEPTIGLDPIIQQRFLELLAETHAAGQTVFMSSHILGEVQQSADRVGIVRDGKLVALKDVDDLRRQAARKIEIHFAGPVPAEAFSGIDGLSDVEVADGVLRCRLAGQADQLVKAAARFTVETLTVEEPDLEDLFFSYYGESEPQHAE
jgi:beta-exotoxin I transport system ATP-binding protein